VAAIALSSVLSGGVFVVAVGCFARSLRCAPAAKAVLCFLAVSLASTVMFFGYVETTQVELAAMAVYFALSAAVLGSDANDRKKQVLFGGALSALTIAAMAHAGGLLLLPSCLPLLMWEPRASGAGARRSWTRVFSRRNFLALTWLLIVPFYLVVVMPYWGQGKLGNLVGGGDKIPFVPLHVDYLHSVSPNVYYSMFSIWHLADLANCFLLFATATIPLLALLYLARPENSPEGGDAGERAIHLQLGIATVVTLLIPLFWRDAFGMWGDWNINATYLFPLNLFAWTLFVERLGRPGGRVGALLAAGMPWICLQVLLLCGFLAQFR
jgi:hypothetical protein